MPGGNIDYPFKINIETNDGTQKSYFTSSFATDVESVVSASLVIDKINEIPFGSDYIQGIEATAMHPARRYGHTTAGGDASDEGILFLSASMTHPNTGSIVFTDTETTTNQGLKFYTFWGTKVCSVLGLPEGIPIYPENFKFSDDSSDPENYLSGDVIADGVAVKEGFKMAPQARMQSSLVWDDVFGEGFVQWVSGSTTKLQMGFNASSSKYDIAGSINRLGTVSHLTAGGLDIQGQFIKGLTSADNVSISTTGAGDIALIPNRSTFDEATTSSGQLLIDQGNGINKLAGSFRIRKDDSSAFDNERTFSDFQLGLLNRSGDGVGLFSGIYFDIGTSETSDEICGSIVVARDNSTSSLKDGNMIFSTNDANEDGNTERMRITHDGIVEIPGTLSVASDIIHTSDTNTKIAFTTDQIDFEAGGVTMLTLDETTQDIVVINEGGVDVDFRIEGNSNSVLFKTDAGSDFVTMGASTQDSDSLPRLTVHQNTQNFVIAAVNSTNNTAADGIMVNYTNHADLGTSAHFYRALDSGNDTMYLAKGNGSGGSTVVTSFTAGHDTACLDEDELMPGLIIESTGEVWFKSSASFETALPFTQLSNSNGSKTVFGVVDGVSLQYDATGSITNVRPEEERFVKGGYLMTPAFTGYAKHAPTGSASRQLNTMSLGEGVMWVTNHNGEITNGDYIESSVIKGYGRKQDDDILRSKTVAKCTETINWSEVTSSIQYSGSAYKKYLAAVTFHCG